MANIGYNTRHLIVSGVDYRDVVHKTVYLPRGRYNENITEFRGTKGYRNTWGKYVGNLAVMLEYLKYQRPELFNKYNKMLCRSNKSRHTRLSDKELHELKEEVVVLLKPETQRKFSTLGVIR